MKNNTAVINGKKFDECDEKIQNNIINNIWRYNYKQMLDRVDRSILSEIVEDMAREWTYNDDGTTAASIQ
jgi:hypothetical protein